MSILLIVVAVVTVWAIATYNSMVSLRNKVKEGYSTMDVYTKKRFDLIPNLVATVKGYAAHETETLEKVVRLRNSAHTISEQVEAEQQVSSALRNLLVQVEAYPDLKANANFTDLQQQLKAVEEDIANARRYYNGCAREFNTKVEMFPGNLIAGMFHFESVKLFEVASAAERENVKVDFSK